MPDQPRQSERWTIFSLGENFGVSGPETEKVEVVPARQAERLAEAARGIARAHESGKMRDHHAARAELASALAEFERSG